MNPKGTVETKSSTPSRKEREEAFRRDLVLDAAEHLFADKGFEKTTVSDIAAQSELAKGSLYQLFDSKEAIFCAMVKRKMSSVFHALNEVIAGDDSPSVKIRKLTRSKMELFRDNREFAKIFINEFKGFHLQLSSHFIDEHLVHAEKYSKLITKIFEDGQKKGEFRKDVSASILKASFGGFTNGVIVKWLEKPEEIDIDAAIDKLGELFLDGIMK
ncbi:MAG TPA: TetR/AcrR family transcriptional regulator [bacterium]|jgi:AcrR family transcriptional regulator